jgi:hypothetical protein
MIAMLDFKFACVCGEPAVAPKLADDDWAALVGYGDDSALRWYETEELARERDDFKMLQERPDAGDSRWLALTNPFATVLGESFWCMHQPPIFFHNGLDNDDTEITQISFLRCHLTEVQITRQDVRRDDGGWLSNKAGIARVTVESVMTVDDVLALPLSPAVPPALLWCNLRFAGNTTVVRQGSLIHALCQTNVDWTSWAILHNTPEATDLLAFCNSDDHEDSLRIGRTRLRQGSTMIGPGVPREWLEVGDRPLYVRRDNAI